MYLFTLKILVYPNHVKDIHSKYLFTYDLLTSTLQVMHSDVVPVYSKALCESYPNVLVSLRPAQSLVTRYGVVMQLDVHIACFSTAVVVHICNGL